MIRTEGDYLAKPARVTELLISLGARIEVVVDLTNVRGDVYLKNNAEAPYPDGDPDNLVD